MPPVIDFVANASLLRRGNTDYVETTRGWKPARTFDGATGRWRITRVGRKWFGRAGMPRSEYVILLPCIFKTQKGDGQVVTHRGWYPVTGLSNNLRHDIERIFPTVGPAPFGAGRAALIAASRCASDAHRIPSLFTRGCARLIFCGRVVGVAAAVCDRARNLRSTPTS